MNYVYEYSRVCTDVVVDYLIFFNSRTTSMNITWYGCNCTLKCLNMNYNNSESMNHDLICHLALIILNLALIIKHLIEYFREQHSLDVTIIKH
jgi:hypothetical protein